MQCIGFTLGREYFGIEMGMVLEIIRPAPVIPLPNAPAFIDGVVNIRTGVIPVINIGKKIKLEQAGERTAGSRFLIFAIHGTAGCLAVDSVTGIHEVADPTGMTLNALSEAESEPGRKCTLTVEDRQLKILNLTRIFDADEREQLETLRPPAEGQTHG